MVQCKMDNILPVHLYRFKTFVRNNYEIHVFTTINTGQKHIKTQTRTIILPQKCTDSKTELDIKLYRRNSTHQLIHRLFFSRQKLSLHNYIYQYTTFVQYIQNIVSYWYCHKDSAHYLSRKSVTTQPNY